MKHQCLVIDDEPLGRKIIVDFVSELRQWEVKQEFQDCLEVESFLQKNQVDLMFLDINMPKLNGIQFLRNLSNPPLVIFTTAYSEYAVEAFELEAFDYLVKPISFARFHQSISRAERSLASQGDIHSSISIKEGKRLYKINTDDVFSVQAFGDYVRLHTEEKIYITKGKLSELQMSLPSNFCQVHRSWLINLDQVDFVEGNLVQVKKVSVPVSASYKEDLMRRVASSS